MTAQMVPCPKCGQLNSTKRFICKGCGLDLMEDPLELVELAEPATDYKAKMYKSMELLTPHNDFDRTVVLTDIQIPFWSMVGLLFKFCVAAIPALILLVGFGVFSFLVWDVLSDLRKLIAGP